ncbi:MAG TPA: DUF6600 domain-containing protein [Candidatus Saccharimonadales bacterium]|nr:DUF6600 domain-containing protein [Candidatus Saccharimonadales bacterium]
MKRAYFAIVILAVAILAIGAQAQDQDQDLNYQANRQAAPAPPSEPAQGVARISFIHGDVSRLRGDSGDWTTTTLNTPISRGDWIATGEKSQTELQLDFANILRLSSSSQVKVADLTHTRIQIQMAQGYANFTQFKGSEADVEIDTPNVAVHPLQHGRYRIQVNSESESEVIVRDGEADITTPQGSTRLRHGEKMTIRGTDNPEYQVSRAPGTDDWDRWNKDRDRLIEYADGYRHTNRYYTGSQDLDAYGRWTNVPGYGNVWSPANVDVSWAPYQAGRWVWEPYYGWTWVAYEPWGWAPYHYGRWFFYSSSWYWWPGPVYAHYRPVWSPAFVVFLGFGHHSSFGFGSIGWLPCGPHDYYHPWYGRGFNQVNVTNITNVTNVTNVNNVTNINNINNGAAMQPLAGRGQPRMSNIDQAMTNARVRGSIASVRSEDFGRGVRANTSGSVGVAELRQAQAVTGNLPVVPGRESLGVASTSKGSLAAQGNRAATSERFFTKQAPPAAGPSFQQQQSQVQAVIRAHGGPEGVVTTKAATQSGGPAGVNTPAPPARGGGPEGVVTSKAATQSGGPAGVNTPAPPARGGGPVGVQTPKPPTQGGPAGVMTPAPPAQDQNQGQRSGRDGWRTFGPPRGQPAPSSGAEVRSAPPPPSSGGRQGGGPAGVFTPAPPSSSGSSRPQENNAPRALPPVPTPPSQRNDRVTPPPPPPQARPSVELNRPIVTPRPPENVQRNTAPSPPSRIERSAPSAPRMERSSPPPPQRVERSAPAPRSESHSSSGGGGGGHSSGSSGGGGGHSSGGGGHSSSGDKGHDSKH